MGSVGDGSALKGSLTANPGTPTPLNSTVGK